MSISRATDSLEDTLTSSFRFRPDSLGRRLRNSEAYEEQRKLRPRPSSENRTVERWNAQFRHRGTRGRDERGRSTIPLGVLACGTRPPMKRTVNRSQPSEVEWIRWQNEIESAQAVFTVGLRWVYIGRGASTLYAHTTAAYWHGLAYFCLRRTIGFRLGACIKPVPMMSCTHSAALMVCGMGEGSFVVGFGGVEYVAQRMGEFRWDQ